MSYTTLKPIIHRALVALRDLRPGQRSFHVRPSSCDGIIFSMCVEKGYARVVKHRDHTQSHVLTSAGRVALAANTEPT